ncbi:hypothetical protein MPER_12737 [Moniliophthora perniciosa FA553]|nr:hypothetical protein MPER_12737 [Moniliophthora perniciosa FA553]
MSNDFLYLAPHSYNEPAIETVSRNIRANYKVVGYGCFFGDETEAAFIVPLGVDKGYSEASFPEYHTITPWIDFRPHQGVWSLIEQSHTVDLGQDTYHIYYDKQGVGKRVSIWWDGQWQGSVLVIRRRGTELIDFEEDDVDLARDIVLRL